ncbi:MAG: nuclear transport factor 2 family protein [Henriciella sp.]|uniref:nuclear transport factor 2 family protein n=1 Tax=Henriciella sp. TaxID=1968823 RepID=UPI003C71BEDB
MDHSEMELAANTFFGAVEKGDIDTIRSMYDPDIRIWHSRDEANTDMKQSVELLTMFFDRVSDRKYEVLSRHFHEGGFVQEHIVHGKLKDGTVMRLPVCFLCTFADNGRFLRIAEYCDSAKSPLKGVVQHEA